MLKLSEIKKELNNPRYAYTIAQIARETGLSYPQVYRILNQKMIYTPYENVEKISDWLESKLTPEQNPDSEC